MLKRTTIGALALSASALVGLVMHEGYKEKAYIPVAGDVPTVGFGSTIKEDGSPVQLGDTITPTKALKRSHHHIQKDEVGVKQCVSAPVSQAEYDLLIDFSYQYGVGTLCGSSIVKNINKGNYIEACNSYLNFKYAGGVNCSRRNSGCYGVWKRSKERHKTCMAAQ